MPRRRPAARDRGTRGNHAWTLGLILRRSPQGRRDAYDTNGRDQTRSARRVQCYVREEARRNLPPTEAVRQLVVVGSSAGGIEALSRLVAGLPADFPAPIVVAQHLDPTRYSHLGEILGRRSVLPVKVVDGYEPLEPGIVYVVPANVSVQVSDHHVEVSDDERQGSKPSVDLLFSSAARSFGENLIAVILTGLGSDGTAGARLVKAAGGAVVIQDPQTARFPSMPASLAPSTVDVVTTLDALGPLLTQLVS